MATSKAKGQEAKTPRKATPKKGRAKAKAPPKKRAPKASGHGAAASEVVARPLIFGRWLFLRAVLVYVAFNLGLNLFLNITQPLRPLRLLTVTRIDERLESAAFLFRHYLPLHRCEGELEPSAVRALAREVAREIDLEPALLVALVEVESSLAPHAISSVGAVGLGQLMPSTAAWLKVEDPFHPRENLLGAGRYLKSLMGRFGSLELALAAYNAGPGSVSKYKGIPPFGETQRYVRRVSERVIYHRAQASAR